MSRLSPDELAKIKAQALATPLPDDESESEPDFEKKLPKSYACFSGTRIEIDSQFLEFEGELIPEAIDSIGGMPRFGDNPPPLVINSGILKYNNCSYFQNFEHTEKRTSNRKGPGYLCMMPKHQLEAFHHRASYLGEAPEVFSVNGGLPVIFAYVQLKPDGKSNPAATMYAILLPTKIDDLAKNEHIYGLIIQRNHGQFRVLSGMRSYYRLTTYIYYYLRELAKFDFEKLQLTKKTTFQIIKRAFWDLSQFHIIPTSDIST